MEKSSKSLVFETAKPGFFLLVFLRISCDDAAWGLWQPDADDEDIFRFSEITLCALRYALCEL